MKATFARFSIVTALLILVGFVGKLTWDQRKLNTWLDQRVTVAVTLNEEYKRPAYTVRLIPKQRPDGAPYTFVRCIAKEPCPIEIDRRSYEIDFAADEYGNGEFYPDPNHISAISEGRPRLLSRKCYEIILRTGWHGGTHCDYMLSHVPPPPSE